MASRRPRGFSLVELIVVIGIIAILVALLLPTMSVARDRARQVKCAAQLHGLGQALANYAVAFKGAYPACSGWQMYGGDGSTGDDQPGPGWTEELEPYYAKASTGVFHCPAWEDPTLFNYFIETHWLRLNGRPCVWHAGEIAASAQFVLAGDCSSNVAYIPPAGDHEGHTFDDCDKDSSTINLIPFFGEENGRNVHRNGNNVLFADFHVAVFRKFDPTAMTFHPTRPGMGWNDLIDERNPSP